MDSNLSLQNLQPDIYAALITTTTLAIVAVCLRFLARRLARAELWLDDWLSLLALVCSFLTLSKNSYRLDNNVVIRLLHWVGTSA
jgi:hypothetical protein